MTNKLLINNLEITKNKELNLLENILLVLIGTVFLATFAQIKIMLPFTPVPITGQTFAVAIIGLLYGRKIAPLTIINYILLGTVGLPVYAGFNAGFPLLRPTGGYMIGWVFATIIYGYFAEKGYTKSFLKTAFVIALGYAVIYAFGMAQLTYFVGTKNVMTMGLVPFIPGDTIKLLIVAGICSGLDKIFRKN